MGKFGGSLCKRLAAPVVLKGNPHNRNAVTIASTSWRAGGGQAPPQTLEPTNFPWPHSYSTKSRIPKPTFQFQPDQLSPLDITDERLMEMIQDRDPEGIAMLHDRYASLVKAMIMRVLHNDAESDDMLQEIFVEIWNRAASYDSSKGKPLGWMVTLSRRRAIDRLRKREAYGRMEERLQEQTKHTPQTSAGSSRKTWHMPKCGSTQPRADQPASRAAPGHRTRLLQRNEPARDRSATGIPLGTIKTRLELGIKKLSEALAGFEDLL